MTQLHPPMPPDAVDITQQARTPAREDFEIIRIDEGLQTTDQNLENEDRRRLSESATKSAGDTDKEDSAASASSGEKDKPTEREDPDIPVLLQAIIVFAFVWLFWKILRELSSCLTNPARVAVTSVIAETTERWTYRTTATVTVTITQLATSVTTRTVLVGITQAASASGTG